MLFFFLFCTADGEERKRSEGGSFNKSTKHEVSLQIKIYFLFSKQYRKLKKQAFKLFFHNNSVIWLEIWHLIFRISFSPLLHWKFPFGKIILDLWLCIAVCSRISSKKWKHKCDVYVWYYLGKKTKLNVYHLNGISLLRKQHRQPLSYLIIAFHFTQSQWWLNRW